MQLTGQLITLDRTLPLVRIADRDLRAEYAVSFSREGLKATVGDWLELQQSSALSIPQIVSVLPRSTSLVRRLCREHPSVGTGLVDEQLLAANFDRVIVVTALGRKTIDLGYLERQLITAYSSGAEVSAVLNKTDISQQPIDNALAEVQALAAGLSVLSCSAMTGSGIAELAELCPAGSLTVFFGRSGVGKSSLINALIGSATQVTKSIREHDQAGRHATVARRMVFAEQRAYFDTPGVRSIGVYQQDDGLSTVFEDIGQLAGQCRFRDCKHQNEPGCAVQSAIESGELTTRRLMSYLNLASEVAGDDVLA
ncbi:MAG: ribosome small subunit-dependent GTPase A [Coriobacteriales bacterium]|jgi:ribosome biogenesis GTPase|nr:ribosome small subunit-dependent GTPase A [Coriobacteriales bacterium]